MQLEQESTAAQRLANVLGERAHSGEWINEVNLKHIFLQSRYAGHG